MPEDWLLGMSYLFSIQKNCTMETQNVLVELPQTELYTQTAIYYYCLELHKRLYRDFENLYLFTPLNLIWKIINVTCNSKDSDIYENFKYWQARLLAGQEVENTTFFDTNKVVEENEKTENYEESKELKTDSIEKLTLQTVDKNEIDENFSELYARDEIEWTNGNFSDEDVESEKNVSEHELNIDNNIPLTKDIGECTTEKDRFEAFEKMFNRIRNADHFHEIKEMILQWPKFNNPAYTTIDKHPIIKIMKLVNVYITEKDSNKHNKQIFQEYKMLIKTLSSLDVSLRGQLITSNNNGKIEFSTYY